MNIKEDAVSHTREQRQLGEHERILLVNLFSLLLEWELAERKKEMLEKNMFKKLHEQE